MALKLVIEPIFEADFCEHSYGFRPQKSAHQAIDAIADGMWQGQTQVIDADLSKYFDSIPHIKLLATGRKYPRRIIYSLGKNAVMFLIDDRIFQAAQIGRIHAKAT
jgi:retron-type reverse transcriptase